MINLNFLNPTQKSDKKYKKIMNAKQTYLSDSVLLTNLTTHLIKKMILIVTFKKIQMQLQKGFDPIVGQFGSIWKDYKVKISVLVLHSNEGTGTIFS